MFTGLAGAPLAIEHRLASANEKITEYTCEYMAVTLQIGLLRIGTGRQGRPADLRRTVRVGHSQFAVTDLLGAQSAMLGVDVSGRASVC